jgi:hypothetical protein
MDYLGRALRGWPEAEKMLEGRIIGGFSHDRWLLVFDGNIPKERERHFACSCLIWIKRELA